MTCPAAMLLLETMPQCGQDPQILPSLSARPYASALILGLGGLQGAADSLRQDLHHTSWDPWKYPRLDSHSGKKNTVKSNLLPPSYFSIL